MGFYDMLNGLADARKGGASCKFNGYLEDYLDDIASETEREVLTEVAREHESIRVIVGFHAAVSKDSVSNAIIRYKDIYKLEDNAICVPYILYFKEENVEKAVVIHPTEFVFAKAMYYSLTETGACFEANKNDFIAATLKDAAQLNRSIDELVNKNAGQVQRFIDRREFASYDDALAHAMKLSEDLKASLDEDLKERSTREDVIHNAISVWFMLKKFVYVQFMVDKKTLAERFEGNIKKQRSVAKSNADSIFFVSISEMWKGSRKD